MSAKLRDSLEWLLMVAMILGGGAIARGEVDAAADEQPTGKIVQIGPADDGQIAIDPATLDLQGNPVLPKQWIGIYLSPVSDEMRAQIEVLADRGVLVEQVLPESPASKAGLKPLDILLSANGKKLADTPQLTELVRAQGDHQEKITLEVLRRGKQLSVELTPESRPDVPAVRPRVQTQVTPGPQAWHLNPGDPLSRTFRGIPGPRTMPGFGLNQMPSGVSVSIKKQNVGPAHIKVQRGNDTWDIVGDDPSSLAQLPSDLRPFVEQLLAQVQTGKMGSMPQMQLPQTQMPMMPGRRGQAGFRPGELQQRLDQMQQQLEELQQQMRDEIEAMDAASLHEVDGHMEGDAATQPH